MFLVLFSALLTTVPTASAHLIMNTPVPYGAYANPPIDNSPLVSTGANFPCKVTDDPGTWYSQAHIADANTYAAGSVQTLAFNGSATHGGGSCQLALTSDMQPSAQTSWRVILSIESGCPTTDGVNPATYDWTVPADLAPGKYSFAWTWISKEAGQPEYYMNCAPITVTASPALKRRLLLNNSPVERRAAAAAAAAAAPVSSEYPELFVANLESVNSCKIGPDVDPLYPAPGPNVEKLLTGSTPAFASHSTSASGSASAVSSASSAATVTGTGSGSGGGGYSSSSTSSTTVETKSSTAVVSSTKTAAATTSSISASVSAKTTSTTSTSTTAPSATSTPASSGSGSNTTTTATTKSGTCTDEGMFNCVGSDYQQCASGGWTTMQALPAGTTCQQGESMGLWARSASVVDEVAGRGGKPGTEKRSAGEDAMRGKGNGEDKRKVKMWRDGRRRLGRVVGAQADDSS
ncbi:hypothetical protein BD289DRAFT_371789 [Coniella lustricola]|uniref:Chitin-binding type-4 domain-containing protein n=1 Tax=Coniella lustricola TaxID=2025994 RepID=A0A2T3A3C5_9PEZI|nr:hypothetical protein BD289DRAFT_371789 [Coniella lustricola]